MPRLSVQQNLLFSAAACQIRCFFSLLSSSVLGCDLSCSLKHKELLVFTQQRLRLPSELSRLMAGVVCNKSRALLMGHQQAVGASSSQPCVSPGSRWWHRCPCPCPCPLQGSYGCLARWHRRVWTAAVCSSHKSTFRPGQWWAGRLGCVLSLRSQSLSLPLSVSCPLCGLSHSRHMLSVGEDTFTNRPPSSGWLSWNPSIFLSSQR